MITGAHSIVCSTNPDADRAVLRDVFKLTHVDVGGGWLIFGLPPAEVAVHPSDKNGVHELYLMCADVEALVAEMTRRNLSCASVQDEGWGLLTAADAAGRRHAGDLSTAPRTSGTDGGQLGEKAKDAVPLRRKAFAQNVGQAILQATDHEGPAREDSRKEGPLAESSGND
jgi:hypothetical protein